MRPPSHKGMKRTRSTADLSFLPCVVAADTLHEMLYFAPVIISSARSTWVRACFQLMAIV